jgi:hypothetical protein
VRVVKARCSRMGNVQQKNDQIPFAPRSDTVPRAQKPSYTQQSHANSNRLLQDTV